MPLEISGGLTGCLPETRYIKARKGEGKSGNIAIAKGERRKAAGLYVPMETLRLIWLLPDVSSLLQVVEARGRLAGRKCLGHAVAMLINPTHKRKSLGSPFFSSEFLYERNPFPSSEASLGL